ncbi:unnamed protein product [Caenorhabditis auriculariae]|uniref:Cystinosin n=1 Tax=Caenorhabditis auriculariae TaxID=2777116 RepID=A0A8S1HAY2_9PELO|nr:unnamed protein product [Caenorhabditis auriculariae]
MFLPRRERVCKRVAFGITIMLLVVLIFLLGSIYSTSGTRNKLLTDRDDVTVLLGEQSNVTFFVANATSEKIALYLSSSPALDFPPVLELVDGKAVLPLFGKSLSSGIIVEVLNCTTSLQNSTCPLDLTEAFVRVTVIRSKFVDLLVDLVGWAYFFAWSISFYPQMYLNYRRKSVIGLNFDFLTLNVIGFAAYACFNLLMYFNSHVKSIYHAEHPHSPPPVLANDVVFAVHAFFACVATALQCLFYEKDNQKISTPCVFFGLGLILFGAGSGAVTILHLISILAFVSSLSYIKMAVTMSKYFPQAYYNFIRKSTVGWSIGNVLLDLTGGTLDIFQMVLQAVNAGDWSAFYTNPVKFGLGLVSIVFDLVFILQHYVLYPDSEVPRSEYDGVENPVAPQSEPVPQDELSTHSPILPSRNDL